MGQATKPRRSAGEGAIYDTADGRLRGSLLVQFPDGRTKRVYVSGRTRAEVVRKLDAKRREGASGALTGETLEAYLTRWLQVHETRIRPSTRAEYGRIVRQYWLGVGFTADLRKRPMTRLQPIDVEQRMTELLARKLSPTTVRYARGVLRRALNDGMREGVLNRNVAAQAVQRLAAARAWQDQADLMFTDALGKPMRPDAVSRVFHDTATRLGLQPIRFHDLRHSAASLMLAQGVPLKTVSETLGHASIAITADVYGHVTPHLRSKIHRQAHRRSSVHYQELPARSIRAEDYWRHLEAPG